MRFSTIVSVVTLVWGISPRQPSGKNIIRWLLKKRTNGSVRYCQYTSPDLVIPDALAAEGSSKRDWNRFLDSHYRRGWNVNVSRVMDNATHVAVYFGSYLKKPPVPMSRLEHYAGQDEIDPFN